MIKDLFNNYIYPVVTLSASIIGAGFLSLPYITLKVGIFTMLFYFAVLTALVLFLHLIFGEICLRTPDFKRWPGFVGFYLGKGAKKIILFSDNMGLLGILLAYLLIGSRFLTEILSPIFGGNNLNYALIYFIPAAVFVYFGVKLISRFDFFALFFLLLILFLISIKGFSQINLSNIFIQHLTPNTQYLFLPYGAIIFSLWGAGFIPEIEEMVRGNKRLLKKIITSSILLAAIFYLLFIFVILGISGSQTTDSALTGLKNFLKPRIYSLALSIGVMTTFIAFISTGLLLKKILMYDLRVNKYSAWLLTCFLPLILLLSGFNLFIPLISLIGGVFLGIDGILILLIYKKIGGKKLIAYPLMSVFILGIIYSIFYFSF